MGRVTLRAREGETDPQRCTARSVARGPAERSTAIVYGEMPRAGRWSICSLRSPHAGSGGGSTYVSKGKSRRSSTGALRTGWMRSRGSASAPLRAPLAVAREAVIDVSASRYAFRAGGRGRACRSSSSSQMTAFLRACDVERGSRATSRARIAPARTFCFAYEVEELARRGLASHVSPESVVVIGAEILAAGRRLSSPTSRPATSSSTSWETSSSTAGPRAARVAAYRPGHSATHEAIRIALERGVLVPLPAGREPR